MNAWTARGKKVLEWMCNHGLIVTVGLALAVKIYLLVIREYVIVNDGMLYVTWIRKICEGGLKVAFTNAYPFNLFPLAAAGVHKLSGGLVPYEESALIVNFICGLLALVPVYLLARRHFGKVAALASGLYVALHPIFSEISCQVLREASAYCFALWAIYFLVVALENCNPEKWDYKKLFLSLLLLLFAIMIRLETLSLFAVGGLVILLAHAGKGRPYFARRRLLVLTCCGAFLLLLAGTAFVGIKLVKHSWDFCRIDKIFSAQAMGEQKYEVKDPLKPVAEIYDAKGNPVPLLRTRYAFQHLAWDHQRALFGYEILYKTWKTLHPVGLVLLVAGLYYLLKEKPVPLACPLNVCALALTLVMGAIYYRYVSTKFAISNRHIVLPVFVLAAYMGLSFRYFRPSGRLQKAICGLLMAIALAMLFYKALRPLEHHRAILKRYGEQVGKMLPPGSRIIESDGLKHIAYYAGMKHKMWASQTADELIEQMKAKTNTFLIVNQKDQHAKLLLDMEEKFVNEGMISPATSKYDLSIYSLAPEHALTNALQNIENKEQQNNESKQKN